MGGGRQDLGPRLLLLAGLLLLAVNLRPAAVSVGPVLAEVREGLAMSTLTAGLLTSLPVLAFAGFGALAPQLARRIGVHRVTLGRAAVRGLRVGGPSRRTRPGNLPAPLDGGAGRDGRRERAAPVAGQAALPRPDRSGHGALHRDPGGRPHRRSDADGPDRGGDQRVAGGPRRLGRPRGVRRPALAAPDRPRPPPRPWSPRRGPLRGRPDPARPGHGPVLRAAVHACLRDLRVVRAAVARRGLLPRVGRAPRRASSRPPASRSRCGCRPPRLAATTSPGSCSP